MRKQSEGKAGERTFAFSVSSLEVKGGETGEEEILVKESFDPMQFKANEDKMRGFASWVFGDVRKFGGKGVIDGR